MKESRPTTAQRLRAMHDQLARAYGPQHWWPAKTPFEMILGAYLTQNTSWTAVERSLQNLRSAGALTIEGIRALSMEKLRELIRPSGFITRKAPAIKAFVALVDEEFAGSLEEMATSRADRLRMRLLALPGVGPETADAILLYAFGKAAPVADEYLRRIAERHRLLTPAPRQDRKGYEALTKLTLDAFSADSPGKRAELYNEFHALVVAVGKAHCGRTADCSTCPLAGDLRQHVETGGAPSSRKPQGERKGGTMPGTR